MKEHWSEEKDEELEAGFSEWLLPGTARRQNKKGPKKSSLYRELLKLAHEVPETRKHLLPLLRK